MRDSMFIYVLFIYLDNAAFHFIRNLLAPHWLAFYFYDPLMRQSCKPMG